MGQTMSARAKKLEVAENKAAEDMRLELAQLSATLKAKEGEFLLKLIQPDCPNSKIVPTDSITRLRSRCQVNVSTAPSTRMDSVVESMFGEYFLRALKGLALLTVSSVLGNTSVGEKEVEGMACILLHSAIVRVDYFMYAYTLRTDGVITKLQNGLVFAVAISTVKLRSASRELIAFVSGRSAENAVMFMNRQSRIFQGFVDAIEKNAVAYSACDCITYICTYFYDALTDEQMDFMDDQCDECKHRILLKAPAGPPELQTRLNRMLATLSREAIEDRTTLRQVHREQEDLLDQMTDIYRKIAEMERPLGLRAN